MLHALRTIRGALVSLVALGLVATVSVLGTLPADASPAPALPAPMVFNGQRIGNSSASDYPLGMFPTGGYAPYVQIPRDSTYVVGTDRYSADGFRVKLFGRSWRQKWSPDTSYGGCHRTSDTGLVKPPATPAKVTYKTYSGTSC